MKKIVFYLIFAMVIPYGAVGQAEIGRFITSGAQDMENLTKAFLEPFGKGFGTAMNSGWYWTAEAHKSLGFDFTINATMVTVPTADNTFSFSDYDWQLLSPGSSLTSPTITGGSEGASIGMTVSDGQGREETINNLYTLPGGVGINTVPLPMMQLGVGVYKGTDVTFRFFPEMDIGDVGKIGMLGFGIKHDFKQWIPVVKELPFHMALQAGWSRLGASYGKIDYFPTDIIDYSNFEVIDPTLPDPTTTEGQNAIENDYYRSQDLSLTTTSWNANFIISKKLSVFTAFGSIGYSSSNFNISLNGSYLIPQYIPFTNDEYNLDDDSNQDGFVLKLHGDNKVKNPINADIEYSSINTAIGFQLKLAIVSLHAAYIYQSYSMVNFGLGFSFR